MRVEPRALHNVFPSLLPQQLATLAEYYNFRKAETARIAGLETQAYVFEPKDGMRYGHKFWADTAHGVAAEGASAQRKERDHRAIRVHRHPDRHQARSRHVQIAISATPADWQVRESAHGDVAPQETGWVVKDLPPGFSKVVEGYRTLRGKPDKVAHLVFSDGLVAVSVFVEPTPSTPQPMGLSQQGGVNVYSRPLNEHLVTVLGEAPGATVRQIAYSVSHR